MLALLPLALLLMKQLNGGIARAAVEKVISCVHRKCIHRIYVHIERLQALKIFEAPYLHGFIPGAGVQYAIADHQRCNAIVMINPECLVMPPNKILLMFFTRKHLNIVFRRQEVCNVVFH